MIIPGTQYSPMASKRCDKFPLNKHKKEKYIPGHGLKDDLMVIFEEQTNESVCVNNLD